MKNLQGHWRLPKSCDRNFTSIKSTSISSGLSTFQFTLRIRHLGTLQEDKEIELMMMFAKIFQI
jgi:hypothetical protein